MIKLKDIDYRIISELIKNSKISDRKLARIVGVSQPTVTRRRARLEKAGLLDYTTIPDLKNLGFEIIVFTFASGRHNVDKKQPMPNAEELVSKHPNFIFFSSGRGMGMDRMAISLHKNYSDYVEFMREIEEKWGACLDKLDNFAISLKSDNILREITFKHLSDYMKKMA